MDYHVVFTNNALYTFFRLFQVTKGIANLPSLPSRSTHNYLTTQYVVFMSVFSSLSCLQFLCDRLNRIYQQAVRVTEEETVAKQGKAENIAVQLGLKKPRKLERYVTL